MPKVMEPDGAQARGAAGGVPGLVAEPVGGDVPVGVADLDRAGVVLAGATAPGAVGGVGGAAVLAPARRQVVGGHSAVPVAASVGVGLGHAERPGRGGGAWPGPGLGWRGVGEQQVVRLEVAGRDVGGDLSGDLLAELEPPVLLVFRVVLDQEPAGAVGIVVGAELDDGAADGQDAGGQVQVTGPQLGQLAPAHPALDSGLGQELGVRAGQRVVEPAELAGGDDAARLGRDRRGLDAAAGVDGDDLVFQRGGEATSQPGPRSGPARRPAQVPQAAHQASPRPRTL